MDNTIRNAIQQLAGTHLKDDVVLIACLVESVDIPNHTCTCTAIGGKGVTSILNVQLMAEVEDGLLLVPVIGSTVIVSYSTYTAPVVVMFSGIDQVFLSAATGIQLNDGSYGGLIQIEQLVTKLNNLEKLVNDLVSKFNIHIHPLTTGTSSPTLTQETSILVPTQQTELENTTVTHGK